MRLLQGGDCCCSRSYSFEVVAGCDKRWGILGVYIHPGVLGQKLGVFRLWLRLLQGGDCCCSRSYSFEVVAGCDKRWGILGVYIHPGVSLAAELSLRVANLVANLVVGPVL